MPFCVNLMTFLAFVKGKDLKMDTSNRGNTASGLIKELISEMIDTWSIVNEIFDDEADQAIPASEIFEQVITAMKNQMGFAASVSD